MTKNDYPHTDPSGPDNKTSVDQLPKLQWVIVDGVVQHVSTFAHMAPQERPEAICPICSRSIILKLGSDRKHHAAHRPGDICVVSQPETALHLNIKYYLIEQAKKANEIFIEQVCYGSDIEIEYGTYHNSCDCTRDVTLAKDWDRVEAEFPIGPYIADIALLRDKNVVAVIEILVTHETELPKKEYLSKNGIAWVEIQVSEGFYFGQNAWTPQNPLPTYDWDLPGVSKNWKCERCLQQDTSARRKLENQKR